MAKQLIGQMQAERFEASRYSDEVRERIRELVERKIQGADVVEEAAAEAPRAGKVVDLMDALKASLAQRREKRPARPKPARPHAPLRRAG
jgi:DNA end-binding protein Ku